MARKVLPEWPERSFGQHGARDFEPERMDSKCFQYKNASLAL